MATPRVSVIILNWNGFEDTRECLESLSKQDYGNLEVILVDNGSVEEEKKKLRELCKNPKIVKKPNKLDLIFNSRNKGFSGGNNDGIKLALRSGADFVFLLNNDTTLAKNCIRELVHSALQLEKFGAANPMIFYHSHPKTIWAAGAGYWNFIGKTWLSEKGKEFAGNKTFTKTPVVPQLVGAALFVPASVLKKTSLLDEGYFSYYEEAKLCEEIKVQGQKLHLISQAIVWHKVARSGGGAGNPKSIYYLVRNRLYFILDCVPWFFKPFAMLSWVFELFARTGAYLMQLRFDRAKAVLKGAIHALSGKKGELL